jgi:fatty-acid desaturase
MVELPNSLKQHRVAASSDGDVTFGKVRYSPVKSLWFIGLLGAAVVGGISTFSIEVFLLFCASTAFVLLFGHSLGSHRKLVHNSFECPRWLEYCLVYCGIHVGLAGPLGILKQHELRDYAQRLPNCHPYLRHGSTPWRDAWWQLNCELALDNPPAVSIESHIEEDRFYRFLEKTWMAHHALIAAIFYWIGGWSFVFWGVCARVSVSASAKGSESVCFSIDTLDQYMKSEGAREPPLVAVNARTLLRPPILLGLLKAARRHFASV